MLVRGFRAGRNQPRRKPAGHAADRNKSTLQEVGDVSRIRSKASFASLSGTAPLIASSGQTHRHRLNRKGNRQLNWALHYIALVQARTTPEAKAYLSRQREAGKSHKEAIRCLKRHLSNVVYRHLLMDARSLEQAA
jgi:transposase